MTAFVATVSKGGMLALLVRFFAEFEAIDLGPILSVFALIAIASMLAGNLLALLENNVKRILAYSSIAHLGYVLVALLAVGVLAAEAVTLRESLTPTVPARANEITLPWGSVILINVLFNGE